MNWYVTTPARPLTNADALTLIPTPEHRAPDCPCCWAELEWEDGWTCTDCQIWWDTDLRAANYLNDDTPPCNAEPRPSSKPTQPGWTLTRCPLPRGHKGDDHHHAFQRTAGETA